MAKASGKNVVTAVVVGAVAGYVTGILTAPKSGKETRKDIKDKADKYAAEAGKRLQAARDELNVVIEETTQKAKYYSDKGKKEVHELVGKAKVAQTKAKDVLQAVKQGEAQDKDLHKALTEASEAKQHLIDYLKKS